MEVNRTTTTTISLPAKVIGTDRHKYFTRPNVALENGTLFDTTLIRIAPQPPTPKQRSRPPSGRLDPLVFPESATAKSRTIGTQSIYRENDTQTDPYSPDYVVVGSPTNTPEIIHLQRMGINYAEGTLPIGLNEAEMIERARQRRVIENSLPPVTVDDPMSFQRRRAVLEDMEHKENEYQIAKASQEHSEQMEHLSKKMALQDQNNILATNERLGKTLDEKEKDKNDELKKIERRRIKALRKLGERQQSLTEHRKKNRDIIAEYADPASKVYAPPIRDGTKVFSTTKENFADTDQPVLRDTLTLLEIENSIFRKTPKRERSVFNRPLTSQRKQREELELNDQLANVDEALKARRRKAEGFDDKEVIKGPPPSVAQKVQKPIPRPPTPTIQAPLEHDEEKNQAVILLQRLIRGRAVQNLMFEGKERRRELIIELRTEASDDDIDGDKLYENKTLQEIENENIQKGIVSSVYGWSIGHTLDFLGKELVRLREVARIQQIVQAAETTRRVREAEESSRRVREEKERDARDAQYHALIQVNYTSIQTYLQSITHQAIKDTSRKHALERVQNIKQEREAEEQNREPVENNEELLDLEVMKLVNDFLLPSVERETERMKNIHEDMKYKKAVHDVLGVMLKNIVNESNSRPTSKEDRKRSDSKKKNKVTK